MAEAKKPTGKAAADDATMTSSDSLVEMNAKLDKLIELGKAIDWKMWVYLKANNYID